jgi:hypothetical protein
LRTTMVNADFDAVKMTLACGSEQNLELHHVELLLKST